MAYNYLDEKQLQDALHDSEEYMQTFHEPLAELERITEGRPGKVPKGKPRITDGTLAGYKRETPKQVIQQLPTGKVVIRKRRDLEDQVSAILTDIILPNANDGGTPYEKAIQGLEDVISVGSAWAMPFYNRRGDLFHADYKLVYVKDILFEKGKVSEHSSNYMGVIEWLTESDVKAEIWKCTYLKKQAEERGEKYEGTKDAKAWQELLDNGPAEKDEANQTRDEKNQNNNNGYFKVVRFMQIGVGATFYRYAPTIDKVLSSEVSKDPRGIIPLHGLVGAPSRSNPLGRPLVAISAGKQNLLDFRMQMEQYREIHELSPTLKKWGNTPKSRIVLQPDKIIQMDGTRETDDFEPVSLVTTSGRNYTNDSSYIVTKIYNEQGGSNDTSVGADAGSVGFSKTDNGVKAQQARTNVSKDHLRRLTEEWHGRIFETMLNIHLSESQGQKTLELEDETMQRLNLQDEPVMDYDEELGKVKWTVAAGTSQAEDNNDENEKLVALMEQKRQMVNADDKDMKMYNQIVKNSGVDDAEKLMYTDEELELATQMAQQRQEMMRIQQEQAMKQLVNPPQPLAPEAPQDGQPVQEGEVIDPVAEDREIARQQLIDRGATDEEAERTLQMMETGEL